MGFFKPDIKKMKAERDVEGLIKALQSANGTVRGNAALALGELGDVRVEPLIQALKDKNAWVRGGAAKALGWIKDARAVEPLIQVLKYKALTAHSDPYQEMEEDNWVRGNAAIALGEIGDARAIKPLTQVQNDEEGAVRFFAAEALKKLKAKEK